MQLQKAIRNVIVQLSSSLEQLTAEQYTQQCHTLFNATIGQHVRHIVESFICLDKGYASGIVSYDNRKRDTRIEADKALAISMLHSIYEQLMKPDKKILLEVCYDKDSDEVVRVESNYNREVVYNLEHAVHHMALIRVGIKDVSAIILPDGYGMASSTIKYKQKCAQ